MRGRLQKFLPIVLLALAMQILAPIAACWAAAVAAADPLRQTSVICHDAAGSTFGPGDHAGGQGAHAGACSICCVAQANASFDAPQPGFATPARDAVRLVWRDTVSERATSRVGSNAQARAPPGLS
jgi:hypothetical protein